MERLSIVSTTSGMSLNLKGSDVIKRGSLYIKRPPTSSPVKLRIKTWQKRYLVLRDTWTDDGDTLLELYGNEAVAANIASPGRRASMDQYVVNLKTVAYVDIYLESRSFPNAFVVFRTGKSPLVFGAKTDLEMREWMMAIKLLADKVNHISDMNRNGTSSHRQTVCPSRSELDLQSKVESHSARSGGLSKRDDPLRRSTPQLLMDSTPERSKRLIRQTTIDVDDSASRPLSDEVKRTSDTESSFLVTVQATKASDDHHLEGQYLLVVSDSDITLQRPTSLQSVIGWSMLHIRKLKSEGMTDGKGDLITLEASSYCGTAQGLYLFRIPSGWDLIQRVRLLASKLDIKTPAAATSSRQQQRDIIKLKNMASSSLDDFLASSSSPTPTVPERNLPVEQRFRGHSKSQWNLGMSSTSVTSSTSKMYSLTGNSYLAVVDDGTEAGPPTPIRKQMALSRSMGSLIQNQITRVNVVTQRNDSGFESSSEEAGHHLKGAKDSPISPRPLRLRTESHGHPLKGSITPPQPPPRPEHTILRIDKL